MIQVRECDVCSSDDQVQKYQIVFLEPSKSTSSIDLCAKHAAPLVELRSHVKQGPGGRPHKRQVLTEAQVKAQKKRPAKKTGR